MCLRTVVLQTAVLMVLAGCGPGADGQAERDLEPVTVLPVPKQVQVGSSELLLPQTIGCRISDEELAPLLEIIDYEYGRLAGGRITRSSEGEEGSLCSLGLDRDLTEEEYILRMDEGITVLGGSYRAVAMATVTLMQLMGREGEGISVPQAEIHDWPDSEFRGLMIDTARNWHDVNVLKKLIHLARWYKLNYVQLHLTDDQLFTFPTETHPELPTPGYHYTVEELRDLDGFARDHGVTLLPEIDIPGHAYQFISRNPDLFGIENWEQNPSTVNMGREEVYEALDEIFGEVADIFRNSPYIHIGADEAQLHLLDEDPDVQQYLDTHDLPSVEELYRHFLVRMNEIVRGHGKETILWEGFAKEGEVEIPRDITVMAWETMYKEPQDLLADGYTIINVSWQPLYVVNDRKWDPEYIYQWNMYRWENWLPYAPAYDPIQLEPSDRIIGGMMASWDQVQYIELPTLRKRVPAMSERIWNATPEPERPLEWFTGVLAMTDDKLGSVIGPVDIGVEGLRHPGLEEGRYNEQYWFDDVLRVELSADPGYRIHYTLDDSHPDADSPVYRDPLVLDETATVRIRAYSGDGTPAGYERIKHYQHHPINAEVEGSLVMPMDELTQKPESWWVADFSETVSVSLSTNREGKIHYTLDNSEPSSSSLVYTEPVILEDSATIRAQLFDLSGNTIGEPWNQYFHKIEE